MQIHSTVDRDEESLGPVKDIRVREKKMEIHITQSMLSEKIITSLT